MAALPMTGDTSDHKRALRDALRAALERPTATAADTGAATPTARS
jgi:hypothetical protein